MGPATTGSRWQMAKKMGRPKERVVSMASIKIEQDAYDEAREAAGITKESAVAYISRVVRERAKADKLENAHKLVEEFGGSTPKTPKKKGAAE